MAGETEAKLAGGGGSKVGRRLSPVTAIAPSESPKRCVPIQETRGVGPRKSLGESEAPRTLLESLRGGAGWGWGRGWVLAEGGADLGYQECPPSVAQQRWWWWPSSVVLVLLALDLATMEGPQELLSGKLQLCFTPAAGTSFLMFRLNDAALRALQECRRQQVRQTPGPVFPNLYPSGSRASAVTLAKGPGDGKRHPQAPTSPPLQVKLERQVPARAPDAGSWVCHFISVPFASALPVGSASDRFPRQPRGKHGPRVCEKGRARGEQKWAPGRCRQGERLRAVMVRGSSEN